MSKAIHAGACHGDYWAVDLDRMRHYIATYSDTMLSADDWEARCCPRKVEYFGMDGNPAAAAGQSHGSLVGVIPIVGPITHRASMFSAFFGGTSLQKWQVAFGDMVANPAVGAIVMDIDSPGGSVSGIAETADMIRAAGRNKPVISVSNTMMASAALYLGSQATEVVVTPSGMIGSLGVYSLHLDFSEALKNIGVKATFIFAGKNKVEGNPYEPLSEEAKEYEQSIVDDYYQQFVEAVARGRNTTVTAVKKDYGQGRMLRPEQAVSVGMANRVGTLESAIRGAAGALKQRQRDRAAADARRRELEILELETSA